MSTRTQPRNSLTLACHSRGHLYRFRYERGDEGSLLRFLARAACDPAWALEEREVEMIRRHVELQGALGLPLVVKSPKSPHISIQIEP